MENNNENLTIWQRLSKTFGPNSLLNQDLPTYSLDKKELLKTPNKQEYEREKFYPRIGKRLPRRPLTYPRPLCSLKSRGQGQGQAALDIHLIKCYIQYNFKGDRDDHRVPQLHHRKDPVALGNEQDSPANRQGHVPFP